MPKSQEIGFEFTITDCTNFDKRCSGAHFTVARFQPNKLCFFHEFNNYVQVLSQALMDCFIHIFMIFYFQDFND